MNKRKRTKGRYEELLNEFITDNYSLEEAVENYMYLTAKENKPNDKSKITNRYYNKTIGTYIRRKDPTLFNMGYEVWSRE